jgi:hypothetical protein
MSMQHHESIVVLEPSFTSAVVTLFITGIIMLVIYLIVALHKGPIYNYFLGTHGIVSSINHSYGNSKLYGSIFKNSRVGDLLDFALCMVVGLIAYVILTGALRGVGGFARDIHELNYVNAKPRRAIGYVGLRGILRLFATVTWIVYSLVFIRVVIPFCVLQAKNLVSGPHNHQNWEYAVLSFVVLAVCIHIHIVLLRLIRLKLRLFGQAEVH